MSGSSNMFSFKNTLKKAQSSIANEISAGDLPQFIKDVHLITAVTLFKHIDVLLQEKLQRRKNSSQNLAHLRVPRLLNFDRSQNSASCATKSTSEARRSTRNNEGNCKPQATVEHHNEGAVEPAFSTSEEKDNYCRRQEVAQQPADSISQTSPGLDFSRNSSATVVALSSPVSSELPRHDGPKHPNVLRRKLPPVPNNYKPLLNTKKRKINNRQSNGEHQQPTMLKASAVIPVGELKENVDQNPTEKSHRLSSSSWATANEDEDCALDDDFTPPVPMPRIAEANQKSPLTASMLADNLIHDSRLLSSPSHNDVFDTNHEANTGSRCEAIPSSAEKIELQQSERNRGNDEANSAAVKKRETASKLEYTMSLLSVSNGIKTEEPNKDAFSAHEERGTTDEVENKESGIGHQQWKRCHYDYPRNSNMESCNFNIGSGRHQEAGSTISTSKVSERSPYHHFRLKPINKQKSWEHNINLLEYLMFKSSASESQAHATDRTLFENNPPFAPPPPDYKSSDISKPWVKNRNAILQILQEQEKWNPLSIFGSAPPCLDTAELFDRNVFNKVSCEARQMHRVLRSFRKVVWENKFHVPPPRQPRDFERYGKDCLAAWESYGKFLGSAIGNEEWEEIKKLLDKEYKKEDEKDLDWQNDPLSEPEIQWFKMYMKYQVDKKDTVAMKEICYCPAPNPHARYGWNDIRHFQQRGPSRTSWGGGPNLSLLRQYDCRSIGSKRDDFFIHH